MDVSRNTLTVSTLAIKEIHMAAELNVEELLTASLTTEAEQKEHVAESQSRIGTGSPDTHNYQQLIVHVPLGAQISRVKGYLRNCAWPDGCDLGSDQWVEVDLTKHHEPIGWATAGNLRQGSTVTSQWVSAIFENWSDCNARYCRLQVFYKLPASDPSETTIAAVSAGLVNPIA